MNYFLFSRRRRRRRILFSFLFFLSNMDDLFYCIRIMQLSTEKLQSNRNSESLRRSALIRSTFVQTRKHFCDLIHSFIKISSSSNALVPVMIEHQANRTKILPFQRIITSQKRKSCHVDAAKRIRLTSSSSSSSSSSPTSSTSSHVTNEITSD